MQPEMRLLVLVLTRPDAGPPWFLPFPSVLDPRTACDSLDLGRLARFRSCFLIRWCQCPANAFGINACIQSVPPSIFYICPGRATPNQIQQAPWPPRRLEMAVVATQFVLWHTDCSLSLLYPREVPKTDMGHSTGGYNGYVTGFAIPSTPRKG